MYWTQWERDWVCSPATNTGITSDLPFIGKPLTTRCLVTYIYKNRNHCLSEDSKAKICSVILIHPKRCILSKNMLNKFLEQQAYFLVIWAFTWEKSWRHSFTIPEWTIRCNRRIFGEFRRKNVTGFLSLDPDTDLQSLSRLICITLPYDYRLVRHRRNIPFVCMKAFL